jgi:PAS domain-containing protein
LFSENTGPPALNAAIITSALETAANAAVATDLQGIILWVAPAFSALTGYSSEEVIGKNPRLLTSGLHGRKFYEDLWTTILAGKTWHGDLHRPSSQNTRVLNPRTKFGYFQDSHDFCGLVSCLRIRRTAARRSKAKQLFPISNSDQSSITSKKIGPAFIKRSRQVS